MPYKNFPNYVDETPGKKYYCTCGESANKPYCDGSHEKTNTGKLPKELEKIGRKQNPPVELDKRKRKETLVDELYDAL